MATYLTKLTPPKELSAKDKEAIFQHFFCRLAAYRNTVELYAATEYNLSLDPDTRKCRLKETFGKEVNDWAQGLLEKAWIVCQESDRGDSIAKAKLLSANPH